MSLLVYRDFPAPVTCVPTVGNRTTMRDVIAVPNHNAGPVAKKSAPIFFMLTPEVSKPPDVAKLVIGTVLETLVSKCISSRTMQASWLSAPRPLFAFVDVAVQPASN